MRRSLCGLNQSRCITKICLTLMLVIFDLLVMNILVTCLIDIKITNRVIMYLWLRSYTLDIYEDNAVCIQLNHGYIKDDRIKNISLTCFFTHELYKSGHIQIQQIRSSDKMADIFSKSLSTSHFEKLVYRSECGDLHLSSYVCNMGS